MTTGQIMMKLREIEAELDRIDIRLNHRSTSHLEKAHGIVCGLIEQMLADDRRHAEARTMGELPFDGGERMKP